MKWRRLKPAGRKAWTHVWHALWVQSSCPYPPMILPLLFSLWKIGSPPKGRSRGTVPGTWEGCQEEPGPTKPFCPTNVCRPLFNATMAPLELPEPEREPLGTTTTTRKGIKCDRRKGERRERESQRRQGSQTAHCHTGNGTDSVWTSSYLCPSSGCSQSTWDHMPSRRTSDVAQNMSV